MKKIFAALAVLGIVLGTTTLITPAHAAYYSFVGTKTRAATRATTRAANIA